MLRNFDIPEDKWQALLRASMHSTPFQTPEFFRLIDSTPGLEAHACAVESGGILTALAVTVEFAGRGLTGFFSRRGIIFGGPLVLPGKSDALDSLLGMVSNELSGRTIYLETRNYSDYGLFKNVFGRDEAGVMSLILIYGYTPVTARQWVRLSALHVVGRSGRLPATGRR